MSRKRYVRDDDIAENYDVFSLNLEEKDYDILKFYKTNNEYYLSISDDLITVENLIHQHLDEDENTSFRILLLSLQNKLEFLKYIDTSLLDDLYQNLLPTFCLDAFLLNSENEISTTLENFFSLMYKLLVLRSTSVNLTEKKLDDIITRVINNYWDELPLENYQSLKENIKDFLF